MKFYHIAVKGLKEIFRDKKGLALLLAFPAIFMLVFGFAFSGDEGGTNPYRIGVINKDEGAALSVPGGGEEIDNFGQKLIETLQELTFQGSDVPLFDVQLVDSEQGDKLLKERDLACVISIPPNFSASVNQLIGKTVREEITRRVGEIVVGAFTGDPSSEGLSFKEGFPPSQFEFPGAEKESSRPQLPEVEEIRATLTIKGDPGYVAYGQVRGILDGIIQEFKTEIVSRAKERTSSYFEDGPTLPAGFIESNSESISGSQSFSIFDYQAPGILVFALLMGAIGVASSLAREVEEGTLERLKLSRMSSFDLLFGTLIPWSIVAIAQVLILFAVAIMIGFSWTGGLSSILLAIVVAIFGGIASVSLGLLIAAFAKSEKHATNLGTLIAVPTSFIVGAFFPLPKVALGKLFGSTFEVYDFLPWTHAAEALRILLTFGGGIGEVAIDIILLVALTAVLFSLGVFFFSRNRLSPIG